MGTLVKGQSSLYVVEETVEGTFVAETAEAQALEPLADGLEFTYSREEIERKTLTSTIEAVEPRLGKVTMTGTIPIEFKAGASAGAAPRGQIMYESLFGGKRAAVADSTVVVGSTTTVINLSDTDVAKFAVGDSVHVKKAGSHEVRPISEIDTSTGAANITLAIPLSYSPAAGVFISPVTTYYHSSAAKSFSAAHFAGGEIREEINGLKAISASIDGWAVNGTPSINFSVEGLDISKTVATPTVATDFTSDALVPVIIHACAWLGTTEVDYTELGLSIENTKADLNSACAASGKIGTRKTAFNVTASINPYMADDNLTRWDAFKAGTTTSLYTYAFNNTSTDGEFDQIVAIWIPNFKITNMPAADQDGVFVENIEGRAFRSAGNDSMFMSFI